MGVLMEAGSYLQRVVLSVVLVRCGSLHDFVTLSEQAGKSVKTCKRRGGKSAASGGYPDDQLSSKFSKRHFKSRLPPP